MFVWHQRPGAFERLAPTWEQLEIVGREGTIEDGDRLSFCLRKGPLRLPWVARHQGFVPGRNFEDVAERSPFARWHHVHAFADGDANGPAATLTDRIDYQLPLDRLSWPLARGQVEGVLEQMFVQRHVRTANDLRRHHAVAERGPIRVALTGSSGLIGTELRAFLTTGGHTVVPVVRRTPAAHEVAWDPDHATIDGPGLEHLDAVVHLAGEPVAGRWTRAKRDRIRSSRVAGTRLLCETLASLRHKPKVLICASGIGIYGNAGEAELDEQSPVGDGFLATVARAWEAATQPARDAGIRVVTLRIGLVTSARGGLVERLRSLYGLGLGGPIGDGRQWQSWIDLDDLVGVIHHAIYTEQLEGPVNAVAPAPVQQAEFAATLARVLGRPAWISVPEVVVRWVFGQLGREILLASQRVTGSRLGDSGFGFDFPTLESSLRHQLGRAEPQAVDRAVARFEVAGRSC
ncbi:Cell division inhibitor [Enhygromyxa salina]|uniref:Cell division inhibitor n=2 Tax=Enhygromyxa salina TaxID=215803 RepID=A0A0C2D0A4_9BACT|nr:Cell division inhibitor [Enhygromyxa salina]